MLSRLKASSGRGPTGRKVSKQSSRACSHSSGLICAGGEEGACRMRYSRRKASSEIPQARAVASYPSTTCDGRSWMLTFIGSSISSYHQAPGGARGSRQSASVCIRVHPWPNCLFSLAFGQLSKFGVLGHGWTRIHTDRKFRRPPDVAHASLYIYSDCGSMVLFGSDWVAFCRSST